jgi:hypothetical protein
MEETDQYYVMDLKGQVVGPMDLKGVTILAFSWKIEPESPVRRSDGTEWVAFRRIAADHGISLPDTVEWQANRDAAVKQDRSEIIWMSGILIAIIWGGMSWLGIGFMFVPMLLTGILYVLFCKLFGAMSSLEILSLPLFNDMRVNRLPGQGLQMLALALSGGLVIAYYAYRIMNQ